jgi:hypothetical protein
MQVTGNLHDKPRPGHPRLLSKRHERRIVCYISSGECSTAVDIQKKLKIDDQIDISAETIRRILKKNGLKSKIKCKKPYLSKKHKKKRLMFAKVHKDWTVNDWKKVIWTDESKFMLYGSNGKQYCWKKSNEPLSERHIKLTLKFDGQYYGLGLFYIIWYWKSLSY